MDIHDILRADERVGSIASAMHYAKFTPVLAMPEATMQ
jgi:hypothetical protein